MEMRNIRVHLLNILRQRGKQFMDAATTTTFIGLFFNDFFNRERTLSTHVLFGGFPFPIIRTF